MLRLVTNNLSRVPRLATPHFKDLFSRPLSVAAGNLAVNELEGNLRPTEIVEELNKYVVGQDDAKRAVAIALRNRWRRRLLPEDLRREIMPRNVLLVGPTGANR